MSTRDNELIKKIIKRFEDTTGRKSRHTKAAQTWFRDNLRKSYGHVRTATLMNNADLVAKPEVGGLYHFVYDPKTKAKLPIYDTFPLVFPFSATDDGKGFMGINMHFLQPKMRMAIFVSLLSLKSTSGYNKNTKLALNYSKLKAMAGSKAIGHAIKRYNFSHMQSKFIKVDPQVWPIVLMLPSERFKKGSNSQAWKG